MNASVSRPTPSRRRRHGLTLMELVIVLVILVALAGVVIPLFPDMVLRGQTSAGSTNVTEIAKQVQLYANLNNGFPDRLDSLTTGTGLASYLPGSTTSTDVTAQTLSTDDLASLNNAGITSVMTMVENTNTTGGSSWNPTFFPYGADNTVALAGTALTANSTVAMLSLPAAQREFGQLQSTTGRYIVFGLGQFNSMLGKSLTEAPIFLNTSLDPNISYSRFGLVFQTSENGTALLRARFLGAIQFTSNGVQNVNDSVQAFYKLK